MGEQKTCFETTYDSFFHPICLWNWFFPTPPNFWNVLCWRWSSILNNHEQSDVEWHQASKTYPPSQTIWWQLRFTKGVVQIYRTTLSVVKIGHGTHLFKTFSKVQWTVKLATSGTNYTWASSTTISSLGLPQDYMKVLGHPTLEPKRFALASSFSFPRHEVELRTQEKMVMFIFWKAMVTKPNNVTFDENNSDLR